MWNTAEFPQSFYWQAFCWYCSWSISVVWKAASGTTLCFSSCNAVLIKFWWKSAWWGTLKFRVDCSAVCYFVSRARSVLDLRKACHNECLCAVWLCVGVDVWCFNKHFRSLERSAAGRPCAALLSRQLTSQMGDWPKYWLFWVWVCALNNSLLLASWTRWWQKVFHCSHHYKAHNVAVCHYNAA